MRTRHHKLILFTLFFLYFLDVGGIGLVFVIFSPLLISKTSVLLDPSVPVATRNVIIGFLLAAYPFTQFLGSPILGELSDRLGRKPILIICALITALSFALSAIAIAIANIYLLFFSRLAGGFAAGTATVTQASISHFVKEHERPRYMAAFTTIGGISWIVFPFLGSLLSNQKVVSWFSYQIPFWMMSAGFFLAFLLLLGWKEQKITKKFKITFLKIFIDLFYVFKNSNIKFILILGILNIFAWLLYQSFVPTFLLERYNFSELNIGLFFAYCSLWWFFGGMISNLWIFKKFSPEQGNLFPQVIVGLGVLAIVFITHASWIFGATLFSNFCEAIAFSCYCGYYSHAVAIENQGKVFGFFNAGLALAAAVAPALGGWLSKFYLPLPFVISSIMILITAILYIVFYKRYRSYT